LARGGSYCAKKDAPPSCDPTAASNFVDGKPDPNQYCGQACDCGRVPCGEYLFDHRNESLQKWLKEEYIGGDEGIGHPDISGMYIDDGWGAGGPSEIDPGAVNDTGLTPPELDDMIGAWSANSIAVQVGQQTRQPARSRQPLGALTSTCRGLTKTNVGCAAIRHRARRAYVAECFRARSFQ
jgi:hypothetical protein